MKNELPDDIDQLKAMLRKQQARLRQYAGQVAGYEQEIERLKAQLDKLRRMLFGQSSEKNRNKLENKIRQAEKRLEELESRLNAAKRCLEDGPEVAESAPPGSAGRVPCIWQSPVITQATSGHTATRDGAYCAAGNGVSGLWR